MSKIYQSLRSRADLPAGILFLLLTGFIAYKNYTYGTFLTGIDNFHIEYNLTLALSRSLNAVWQSFQGLGLVGGLAHASDLPRVLLYLPLSLILPVSFIRYFYTFLCLFLGPLGTYFFMKRLTQSRLAATGAGLFYLFNLATIQVFFMPTEMFVTQYGFLPWLYLTLFNYLDSGKKSDLAKFSLITFFSMPQAMTPTLFFAYLLGVIIVVFAHVVRMSLQTRKLSISGRSLNITAALLFINACWLLPFIYFTLTSSQVVYKSKINRLSSPEISVQGKKYGSPENVALLRGVWFDFSEYVPGSGSLPLMRAWDNQLNRVGVKPLGYSLFGLSVVGIVVSFIKKMRFRYETLALWALGVFVLINQNPPTGWLYSYVTGLSPAFKEALRFPFTKFSILSSMAISLSAGYLLTLFCKVKVPFIKFGILLVWLGMLIYYCFPVFKGYLINPNMRVKVPQEYFDLFSYMSNQNTQGRVMNLPQFTYTNWEHYTWGYRGSGFLWYGMPQPILDRSFDPWSPENEAYFEELNFAIYSTNKSYFNSLLQKYNVSYVLYDTNVIHTSDQRLLAKEVLQDFINNNPELEPEKQFGGIHLYKVNMQHTNYVLNAISTNGYKTNYYDQAFLNFGNYTVSESKPSVIYPFRSFKSPDSFNMKTNSNNSVAISYLHPGFNNGEQQLVVPDIYESEKFLPVVREGSRLAYMLPDINSGSNKLLSGEGYFLHITLDPTKRLIVLNDRYIDAGTSGVYTSNDNRIDEYDSTRPVFETSLYNGFASADLESCEEGVEGRVFSALFSQNEVTLTSDGTLSCIHTPVTFSENGEVLLKLEFDYRSNSTEKPEVCIQKQGSYACLNEALQLLPSAQWAHAEQYIPAESLSSSPLWISLRLDGRSYESERKILYKNLKVTGYKKMSTLLYTPAMIRQDLTKYQGVYSGSSSMPLEIRFSSGWGRDSSRTGTDGVISNCKGLQKVATKDLNLTSDTESCTLSYYFNRLTHSTGLGITVNGSTESEYLPEVCLANSETGNCDIREQLSTKQFFVPSTGQGEGYSLHITDPFPSLVDNGVRIHSVGLTQLPVDWLMAIRYETPQDTSNAGFVVSNDQVYQEGWLAFCGFSLCPAEHVMVNNWENGWAFDHPVDLADISILYWPQMLEYIGFVTILLWTISLLRRRM